MSLYRGIVGKKLISTSPLSDEAIFKYAPSIFSESKHESRSPRYTHIATNHIMDALRGEGFFPFFAVQSTARDEENKAFTRHMLRFRRDNQISGTEVPEIILLNSHDGKSSYQMIPGIFRFVCQNGMVIGHTYGEVRVHHKGNIIDNVIEGAYEVVGMFDDIEESKEEMKSISLNNDEKRIFANAALDYRYPDDETKIISDLSLLRDRRKEQDPNSLWTTFNTIQENIIKGGLIGSKFDSRGRLKRVRIREVKSINSDVKLNRALWAMAEEMKKLKS